MSYLRGLNDSSILTPDPNLKEEDFSVDEDKPLDKNFNLQNNFEGITDDDEEDDDEETAQLKQSINYGYADDEPRRGSSPFKKSNTSIIEELPGAPII